ncbi:DUF92 domain-containing protein [Salipaludibacillus keqinensis]|nr:DUF92 domain-containing protein [Salipaludibacillus keqinensis]
MTLLTNEYVLLVGVVLIAYISFKKEALTKTGMAASIVIGGIITFAFSLYGLLILASFFLSSSILGRKLDGTQGRHETFEEKGEKRDAKQVLANGGWAAAASLLFILTDDMIWLLAFISSLASANSDTWASAIGKQSHSPPRRLLTKEVVPVGQSGGTTRLGNLGALMGSAFVVLIGYLLINMQDFGSVPVPWFVWCLIIMVGFISQWIDALSGDFLQALYQCNKCGRFTERNIHCKKSTTIVKGRMWMDNDFVNHLCTVFGFILGAMIGVYFNI